MDWEVLPRLGNGMDEELKYACCAQEGYLRAGFEDKATYDRFVASGFEDKATFDKATAAGFEDKATFDKATAAGFEDKATYDRFVASGFEDKAAYDIFAIVMSEGYGLSGAAAQEAFLKIKAKTPKLFVRGGGYNQGGTNTTGCVASGNVTPCEEGRSGVWLCGEGLLADCLLSCTSGLLPGRGSLPHRRARRT